MKFKELREKYRSKFPASLVAAAVKIALDMSGNMTGAYKKIEKMKRGLGDDPIVKDSLRLANEEVQKESVTEAYSKNLTDKDIDAQFKQFRDPESFFGDLDKARADMKKDYSPKNSARPKVWTSLRYPVRDGDYYFAFIDKNEKKNMKYNEKLNDALKVALKGGDKKSEDDLWSVVSRELRTYPKSLGWNDTMTREEIYGAIQHMLGKIRESNIIEKSLKTKAGLMVGKRKKAPRYESASVNVQTEGMSSADKKKRLEMIKKAVEKLNARNDAKAKADFMKAMKDMVD